MFLDLERAADRARLAEPELFLARHREHLLVIDEVQFVPELFTHLRPEIDAARRPGRFLLLGSAAGGLLRQRAESLAGRISHVELTPLLASEVPAAHADPQVLQHLWQRGGCPLSLLAASDAQSYSWRQDLIQTFLRRDLPSFGVQLSADALHRFRRMLAHLKGQLFNASQLGQSLGGASHTTAARYLGTLVDAMVVRRLEPLLSNVGKRLVKSQGLRARQRSAARAAEHRQRRRTARPPCRRRIVGGLRHRADRRPAAFRCHLVLLSHRHGQRARRGGRDRPPAGRGSRKSSPRR